MYDKPIELYNEARAKGRKEYNKLKARGKSGHLTSLDGLIKDIEIMTTVDLGEMEIPLRKIKGTYSNFRRHAFSKNFMPLDPPTTEFGGKWIALCDIHLNEGIRDAIKVYEYMNYFYVIEGNKRVSVLNFFDASEIRARVLRLVPRFDVLDEDVTLYYRFLEFNKKTRLNQLWLSSESDYDVLSEALDQYSPTLKFHADKYKHFYHEVYIPFRRSYKEFGGGQLDITTADALILYIDIYDLPLSLNSIDLGEFMPNLINELINYNLEESLDIKTDTNELDRASILKSISGRITNKKLKIAFIYAKNIDESGWSHSHELGRLSIQEALKDSIETVAFESIRDDESLKKVIKGLVEEGYTAIFTTAMIHRKATLSSALIYDKVAFFNCSGNRPYVHMSTYYGRSYETRFLTGMIAGALTKTDILGYTASSPTPDSIACINAFAIGAKMVNPNTVVKVAFTGVWNSTEENEKKIKILMKSGTDIISSKNKMLSRSATENYGITSMLCTVNHKTGELEDYLASPIWKWDVFYKKIINSMRNGSYNKIIKNNKSRKLINFWWGLETGGIDIYMNYDCIPVETQKLINIMKNMIIADQFSPFSGPLKDQFGVERIAKNQILSAEEIIEMDWYVDNVRIHEDL